MTPRTVITALALSVSVHVPGMAAADVAGLIQSAELDPGRAYFIPTHPRVTTTIRFPGEIGTPDGGVTVFTEDAARSGGEYLVCWQQGDPYFTITPLENARLANLNVPFQGETYVLYFYPAAEQLKAVAAVNLVSAAPGRKAARKPNAKEKMPAVDVTRQETAPAGEHVPATPARRIGFLDRLKLLHATPVGPALAALVKAMDVQVAVSREELGLRGKAAAGQSRPEGVAGEIVTGMNDAGLYQLLLLRVVADRRISCIGFICLVRNTSDRVLTFDVNSFGARAGAEYLSQRTSDATPILEPGAQAPAYFIVQSDPVSPLRAANDWKISVDLVSPCLNPGAAITRGFAVPERQP